MINIIGSLLRKHIILLAQILIQHLLVVHLNFTLVPAYPPLVKTTTHFDAVNHHIFRLLNHVLITIEVDLTLLQSPIQTINTNPLII